MVCYSQCVVTILADVLFWYLMMISVQQLYRPGAEPELFQRYAQFPLTVITVLRLIFLQGKLEKEEETPACQTFLSRKSGFSFNSGNTWTKSREFFYIVLHNTFLLSKNLYGNYFFILPRVSYSRTALLVSFSCFVKMSLFR